jgi:thymidylate synthase (FAD)
METKVIILPETTKNPISLIGERAGICWGADTTDKAKNYKRGLDCIKANHGRTLEYVNVEMVLDGYSARVIREWYTHIGGAPTRLQESTRYIDYGDFAYVIPPKIAKNEVALYFYDYAMGIITQAAKSLELEGIPREDIAMLLPLGMTTKIVDKRNLRNLIDMSRQRMCTRAYWEFRELFRDICEALKEYSEEWAYIIDTQMMPKCEVLGYCPEKHSCGRKHIKVDTKEEHLELMQKNAGVNWREAGREIAERWLNDD